MIEMFTALSWPKKILLLLALWFAFGMVVTSFRLTKGSLVNKFGKVAERSMSLAMVMFIAQALLWPTKYLGMSIVARYYEKFYRWRVKRQELAYFETGKPRRRGFHRSTGYDPTDFGGFEMHDLLDEKAQARKRGQSKSAPRTPFHNNSPTGPRKKR